MDLKAVQTQFQSADRRKNTSLSSIDNQFGSELYGFLVRAGYKPQDIIKLSGQLIDCLTAQIKADTDQP